ncbi:dihydrodipicolinate synthase family protein [Pricia sp. S334]|uniref:Dihydrodipicolinate synthase family protein n=1 Tax=Pricia mediterranea TaxID=3076079 RepID=A0ABU3L9W9_9FLAO|nr:dihydrodipicolinate synthase family protein [Pricia sp. S334]MDT7829887.1 dihydrodipicolinate synthase family protein [Pricia sp. S334]
MKDLIAATYAPMRQDGSLNLNAIAPYGEFLKSNKVKGAFVNGSTGDFVSLSTTERKQLIEAWAKESPENFFITNHVGHTNIREAQDLAAHSEELADAICALPPFYFKPQTLDSLLHYCSEIAKRAPSLPFYYYHIPILTGANFPMIDFLRMAVDRIPNFEGIKYSHYDPKDFSRCLHFDQGSRNILFGVDEKLVSSLPLGATGWVGSTYNHLAPLYYKLISSFRDDDIPSAEALQEKAIFFVETLDKIGGFNGAGKSFMRLFGLDMGPSRFPHHTMTDGQLTTAVQKLDEKGILPLLSTSFSEEYLTN